MRRLLVISSSLFVSAAQAQGFPPGAQLYAPLPEPNVARVQRVETHRSARPADAAAVNGSDARANAVRPVVVPGNEAKPPPQAQVVKPVPKVPARSCGVEQRALGLCSPG